MIILVVGLLIGALLSNREQYLRQQAQAQDHISAASLLADIPIPNDAQKVSIEDTDSDPTHNSIAAKLELKTSSSVFNVSQFYLQKLSTKGWQLINSDPPSDKVSLHTIQASKDNYKVFITIDRQAGSDHTTNVTFEIPETVHPVTFNRPRSVPPIPIEHTIAFYGNTGANNQTQQVMDLIKNEGSEAVAHLGNFDLEKNPMSFKEKINTQFGDSFPYLYSPGSHDVFDGDNWRNGCEGQYGCYAEDLIERLTTAELPITFSGQGNLTSLSGHSGYATQISGINLVSLGVMEQPDSPEHQDTIENLKISTDFIKNSFKDSTSPWRICLWQQTPKFSDNHNRAENWQLYEECRKQGAFIITGGSMNYTRSKTITEFEPLTVDINWSQPSQVSVTPGKTFVAQSGLGGLGVEAQQLCENITYPYGCNEEWSSIYSANQQAKAGALFITFNWQGNPYKARGYFKNIDGIIVDDFIISTAPPRLEIDRNAANKNQNSTRTKQDRSENETSPIPNYVCPGDVDLNGSIDILDYTLIVNDFLSLTPDRPDADTNADGIVNSYDANSLIEGFFSQCQDD